MIKTPAFAGVFITGLSRPTGLNPIVITRRSRGSPERLPRRRWRHPFTGVELNHRAKFSSCGGVPE